MVGVLRWWYGGFVLLRAWGWLFGKRFEVEKCCSMINQGWGLGVTAIVGCSGGLAMVMVAVVCAPWLAGDDGRLVVAGWLLGLLLSSVLELSLRQFVHVALSVRGVNSLCLGGGMCPAFESE
ncbi:hypothetical protein M9H77_27699 [Catharanthus roseus]|uniref:Uncharacterized protein n=1 Tax=Catharanthus roseus TaxID=4058 RepID=A0ACC0AHE6_CATRO|nr:hypothetical protein M9H77_27699 [Catharanthus roseus]